MGKDNLHHPYGFSPLANDITHPILPNKFHASETTAETVMMSNLMSRVKEDRRYDRSATTSIDQMISWKST